MAFSKRSFLYVLWLLAMIGAVLFMLPCVHRFLAQVAAFYIPSQDYSRWLRRFTEYAYRPLQCVVILPLIFYCTLFSTAFSRASSLSGNSFSSLEKEYPKRYVYVFLASSVVILLLILTTSSPLYPFNPWNDADIIYTVGKAMAKGMVPYRDLFERKGILLYFIHAVGYWLSPDSFNGIYILECIACFFFLLLAYKTARLYTSRSVLFIIPLFVAILYASYDKKSGDSAEELCLPLLLYPLYVSVRNIKLGKDFSHIQLFFCGLCAGCIFWIKYSMLGFFLGWIIVPMYLYIKKGEGRKILQYAGMFLVGMIVMSVPWLLYFWINHALADWVGTYFLDNILWHIPSTVKDVSGIKMFGSVVFSYVRHIPELIHYNFHIFFLALLSLCFLIKNVSRLLNIHLALTFVFTYLLVLGAGSFGRYYCMPLEVFFVFSLIPLHTVALSMFRRIRSKSVNRCMYALATCFVLTVSILYAVKNYTYIGFMTLKREDFPQYKFARIIKESDANTMLVYKFMDHGFYVFADILPDCKYFFEIGMDPEYQKKYVEQYVKDAKADFIVTDEKTVLPGDGYELVAEERLYLDYGKYLEDSEYYLYKRVGL